MVTTRSSTSRSHYENRMNSLAKHVYVLSTSWKSLFKLSRECVDAVV